MTKGIAKYLIVVYFACAVLSAEFPEEDDVLLLVKENFDDALAEHKFLLVDFCEWRITECSTRKSNRVFKLLGHS